MKTVIMLTTLTLFSFIGCLKAQQKQLVSVEFDYSVKSTNYRLAVTVKKADDTYNGTYQEKLMQKPATFPITKTDFDELAKIIMKMRKPAKKRMHPVTNEDREGRFTVIFNSKGKDITRKYEIDEFSPKKETDLKNEAIDLTKKWIDQHKAKSEIHVRWYTSLPQVRRIYTHVEPADLVEYLGRFVDKSNHPKDEMPGGNQSGSFRWRALKPGVVTVWMEEHYSDNFPEEFEPHGCYIIDENLHVHYSKEETEAARERFKQRQQVSTED